MYAKSEVVQLFLVRRVPPAITSKCGVRGHVQQRFRLDYGIVVGSSVVCRMAKLSLPEATYSNDILVSPPDAFKVACFLRPLLFFVGVLFASHTQAQTILAPVCHALRASLTIRGRVRGEGDR